MKISHYYWLKKIVNIHGKESPRSLFATLCHDINEICYTKEKGDYYKRLLSHLKKNAPDITEKEIKSELTGVMQWVQNSAKNQRRINFCNKKGLFENKRKALKQRLNYDFFVYNTLKDFQQYEDKGYLKSIDIFKEYGITVAASGNKAILNYLLDNLEMQENKGKPVFDFVEKALETASSSVAIYDTEFIENIIFVFSKLNKKNEITETEMVAAIESGKQKGIKSAYEAFKLMSEWKEVSKKNTQHVEKLLWIQFEKMKLSRINPVNPAKKKAQRF